MVINLSWGLTGYLALSTLQASLRTALQANAKESVTADFEVYTRRLFQDTEMKSVREAVSPFASESQTIEMLSMITAGHESRLMQIHAVDSAYPLYGQLKLKNRGLVHGGEHAMLDNELRVWVYPEVLLQLQTEVGQKIELGGQSFVIEDVIEDDPTQVFQATSLAPRVYLSMASLKKTNLLQFGATLVQTLFFRFSDERRVDEAKRSFLKEIKDPAMIGRTYLESSQDSGRMMNYLFDYLALGALVGVSLSGFGMAALIRSWLNQKMKHYAIYTSLGLSSADIRRVFMFQLSVMAFATAIVSFALASAVLPALFYSVKNWISISVDFGLHFETVVKGFLLVWLGALAVALPYLQQLRQIPAAQLFSESASLNSGFSRRLWLWWAPLLIGFWLLSVREANSIRLGSFFVASLFGSYLVLGLLGWLCFRFLGRVRGLWWIRQALLYLSRRPALLSTFLALSIGSLLTTLIPQLRAGLQAEVSGPSEKDLPALFLFDIQDEQVSPLKKFAVRENIILQNISPLIRSRILSINGVPYERAEETGRFATRESEEDARMRNRGLNLSAREGLYESERLLKGRELNPHPLPHAPIELSVEKWYAEKLGLKLGDEMLFDIQGVEIKGQVVNFREVHWNRFEPNFFIITRPESLPDAPKIWLANFAQMSVDQKHKVQADLAREFPNVSSVDVERAVTKVLEIIDRMTIALQVMAGLAWVSGLFVLLALLYRQVSLQKWDANLYRLLGARRPDLFKVFQTQFTVLVISSVVLGSVLSLLLSWITTEQFFDGIFAVDWGALVATTLILSVVSLIMTLAFSFYLARQNPAGVLQEIRL